MSPEEHRKFLVEQLHMTPEKAERLSAESFSDVAKMRNSIEAQVLRQAHDAFVAHCPDHGNQEQVFIACQCLGTEELLRWSRARGGA